MIGLYHYPPFWLHRLPAGGKLAALAVFSIILMRLELSLWLVVAIMLIIGIYVSAGLVALLRLTTFYSLWPILLVIFLAQFLTAGLEQAASTVIRMVAMIMLADLVTMSTPMSDMMDAIAPLFVPFRGLGLDSEKIAFCAALTIRFVPLLLELWNRQAEAWRARTGKRPSWKLIAPFIRNALRAADMTAEALDARGFGGSRHEKSRKEEKR